MSDTMIDSLLKNHILDQVSRLNVEQQREVLKFARHLGTQPQVGEPGENLLRFAGLIDAGELRAMADAIEQGCEKVNPDAW